MLPAANQAVGAAWGCPACSQLCTRAGASQYVTGLGPKPRALPPFCALVRSRLIQAGAVPDLDVLRVSFALMLAEPVPGRIPNAMFSCSGRGCQGDVTVAVRGAGEAAGYRQPFGVEFLLAASLIVRAESAGGHLVRL